VAESPVYLTISVAFVGELMIAANSYDLALAEALNSERYVRTGACGSVPATAGISFRSTQLLSPAADRIKSLRSNRRGRVPPIGLTLREPGI
jgi:hypothetical protein